MQAILWLVSFIGWEVIVSGNTGARVVHGGTLTDTSKTPYVVSIHLNESIPCPPNVLWLPTCAGTIITAVYVILNCQCVIGRNADGTHYPLVDHGFPLEYWAFLAGAWDLHIPDYLNNPATQRRTPAFIHYHPQCYPEHTLWIRSAVPIYDVAVAKMAVPFHINENVKPVKIYSFVPSLFKKSLDEVINDRRHERCTVAGWGSTLNVPMWSDLNVTVPPSTDTIAPFNCSAPDPDQDIHKLKYIRVQARYEVDCLNSLVRAIKENMGPNIFDWPAFEATLRKKLRNQVCALNKVSSPCRSDSGTGLVCDDRYIIGINSFGVGCGNAAPDVYQSVLQVLDWLDGEVCRVEACSDIQHLHSNCRINRTKDLDIIEKCLTTTESVPKNRDDQDDESPSSAPLIGKSKWIIVIISTIIY